MTKKDTLKSYSGREFIRHVDFGIEDIPALRIECQQLADANGLKLEEDDKHIAVGDRFWMKPSLKREEPCKVIFTPSSYEVHVGGHILHGGKHSDIVLTCYGFYTMYGNEQIIYRFKED